MGIATTLAVLGTGATLYSASKDRSQAKQATEAGRDMSEANLTLAREQAEASRKFIQDTIKQGRSDLLKIFPVAQEARRSGIQAGLDMFNQVIPQQIGAFEQGNIQAQRTVAESLPNRIAALKGTPMNLNMQPSQPMGMRGIQFPQRLPPAAQMPNMSQGQTDQIPEEVKQQLISQMLNGMIGGGQQSGSMNYGGGGQVNFGNRREEY